MKRTIRLQIYNQIDTIYRSLPKLECKGLCSGSCGPTMVAKMEGSRIREQIPGQAELQDGITCGYLDANRKCSVYRIRPLICRLFGMTEKMRCPFGCKPERWVTDAEANMLFTQISQTAGAAEFLCDIKIKE